MATARFEGGSSQSLNDLCALPPEEKLRAVIDILHGKETEDAVMVAFRAAMQIDFLVKRNTELLGRIERRERAIHGNPTKPE